MGGVLAGIVVLTCVRALLVFLICEVLQVSVSSADRLSLVIMFVIWFVPLMCAFWSTALIVYFSLKRRGRAG